MKLSKIYSNNPKFKTIKFKSGLNIIYGDVENEKSEGGIVREHNLGKSSLVYLIDFLLLKKVVKSSIFKKHLKKFSDWIFFLEIELNSGEFLTIKRPVNPNTKISFKRHLARNQNLIEEIDWDHKDLSLNSKEEETNPKIILETEYLKFNVAPEFNYRKFLPYLLRTQKDYNQVFELSYFRYHKDWKPLLFALLGFDFNLLEKKYDLDQTFTEENKFIKRLSNSGNSDEINIIKAAIEAKEREKLELENKQSEFDFYKQEENINFDLVRNVEVQISKLNNEEYTLNYNIEQIRITLDKSNEILNIKDIDELFKEVKIFFPNQLLKEYSDVINFSQQITKERAKYLKQELLELEEKIKAVKSQLMTLNKERISMLSILKEKDTFIKYKHYQEDISKITSEISIYKTKLDNANTIESYRKSLEEIAGKIKNQSDLIKIEIDKDNKDFQQIRIIFQDIYKKTFEYTALLVLSPNLEGNIEFDTPVIDKSDGLTGQGDGYTSTRVLCATFILAILIHYSKQSFYRFAYHDGILESWGDNHKINFIQSVRDYCEKNDVQYITSIIKSDIPKGFSFYDEEIVSTLSKDDELFGFQF